MKINNLEYLRHTTKGISKERPVTSSTKLILQEASKLGMEIEEMPFTRIFKLRYKNEIRYFYYQNPGSTSSIAMYATNDKRITRNLLANNHISIPKGYSISPNDEMSYWIDIFNKLKKPLVVKPNIGTQGKDVSVGIETQTEYITAINKAFKYSRNRKNWVIVEEQLTRFQEYRILATNKKIIGVIKRIPANVIGDGKSNIRKLIKVKNADPRRKDPQDHPPLFRIILDDEMKIFLQKQKYSWKSIPTKGKYVFLRGVSNISQGGDSIDFTDKIHDSVKKIALKTINSIPDLLIGGIDFMAKDIDKAQTPSSYAILEVNNSSGLDIHDYPYIGIKRNAGIEFLRVLFGKL